MWTALNESVCVCFPCMLPNTVTTPVRRHGASLPQRRVETFIKFQQILILSQTQLVKLKLQGSLFAATTDEPANCLFDTKHFGLQNKSIPLLK